MIAKTTLSANTWFHNKRASENTGLWHTTHRDGRPQPISCEEVQHEDVA